MRRLLAAACILASAAAAACGTDEGPVAHADAPSTTAAPTTTTAPPFETTVARVRDGLTEIAVYDAPGAPTPSRTIEHPTELGGPVVFLVDEQRPDGWLDVLLPVRPNGSTGWIRADDVDLARNTWHVRVDIAAHRITVTDAGRVFLDEPVGVGKASTPTPGGRYFLKELLQPPDPTTVYGPYAYGLSGFSNALTELAGSEGVIGIHGTDEPSSLGRDVSSGCIRMSNEGITRLAAVLPLGTPVEIVT